jgi:hypothetical protein
MKCKAARGAGGGCAGVTAQWREDAWGRGGAYVACMKEHVGGGREGVRLL